MKVKKEKKRNKIKMIIIILFIIGTFNFGMFVGLMVTNFFGTTSQPSQFTIDLLHSVGINNLRELQQRMRWIKAENIRIPLNYARLLRLKEFTLTLD